MPRVPTTRRWPAAARTAYEVTRTQLEAAISQAAPAQRRLLARVRGYVSIRGRPSISDSDLCSLLAAHAITRPAVLEVLPSLEDSPRWQALDECLRSLLAGPVPVDTRAAIKHARGEAPAG